MPSTVMRVLGSGTRIRESRFLHAGDAWTLSGMLYSTWMMRCGGVEAGGGVRGDKAKLRHYVCKHIVLTCCIDACCTLCNRTWIIFSSLRLSVLSSGLSKGYAPTSITYSITPHDQMSAGCTSSSGVRSQGEWFVRSGTGQQQAAHI